MMNLPAYPRIRIKRRYLVIKNAFVKKAYFYQQQIHRGVANEH